jgi:hypothetical protein
MKNNDKRTKGQVLRLLENAIAQEERMGKQIESLESALADCKKKVEDPLAELTNEALAGSKISFRIDYYKTAEKGPLKGIIEHIPSRQRQTFSGIGFSKCNKFVEKYLPEEKTIPAQKQEKPAVLPSIPIPAVLAAPAPAQAPPKGTSTLLRRALPDIFKENADGAVLTASVAAEDKFVVHLKPKEQVQIVLEGKQGHQGQVTTTSRFQVEVPSSDLAPYAGKPCSVTVLAENLETGETDAQREQQLVAKSGLRVPTTGMSLPIGGYRLTTVLRIRDEKNEVHFRESRLLVVQ